MCYYASTLCDAWPAEAWPQLLCLETQEVQVNAAQLGGEEAAGRGQGSADERALSVCVCGQQGGQEG